MNDLQQSIIEAKAAAWDLRERHDQFIAHANEAAQMVHAKRAEILAIAAAIEAEKQGGEINIAKNDNNA